MVTKRGNGGTPPTYSKTKLVIAEDEALLTEALPDLLHTASSGGIDVNAIKLSLMAALVVGMEGWDGRGGAWRA